MVDMAKLELVKPILGAYRLPILMFHAVNITMESGGLAPYRLHHFESLIANMKREGYVTITAKEAYDFFISGKPVGEKIILITLDDGYADSLIYAAPVLQKYGYTASVLVETAKIGGALRLTSAQIQTLRNTYGWDIQTHGHLGHQNIQISESDPPPGSGGFYRDLKWLPSEGRVETMVERHARVKSDLQQSINILSAYGLIHLFAFPEGANGTNTEIKADNDLVLDELNLAGIMVYVTGEQMVNLQNTTKHRYGRIGVEGETSANPPWNSPSPVKGATYTDIFRPGIMEINVKVSGSNYYGRFPAYDHVRDRFVIGDAYGKIMEVGKDWKVVSGPTTVQRPIGSSAPVPVSLVSPTVFPNGDIWVASITGTMLYKLNKDNIFDNALDEINLGWFPYSLTNDGTYLYATLDYGWVRKVDPITKVVTHYCELPNCAWSKYIQTILKDGILYVGDNQNQAILAYDLINKQIKTSVGDNGYIHWPAGTRLFPWHVVDDNNLICWDELNWGHTALSF